MFKLKSVSVEGFWDKYNINVQLHNDANIFIGQNGTGKTTLINIINAVLSADITMLDTLPFTSAKFKLSDGKKTRTVSVEKVSRDIMIDFIKFKIGTRSFELPALPKESIFKRRYHPKWIEEREELREQFSKLINVSWLSVHREMLDNEYGEKKQTAGGVNPIEARLNDLLRELISYRLYLESNSKKLSDAFERDVLACMLFDESFDTFNLSTDSNLDLDKAKSGLVNAYRDLNVLDRNVRAKIDKHFNRLKESTKNIIDAQKDNTGISVNDILPLSLLRRTEHIVSLSSEMESKNKKIFEPLDKYINIIHSFCVDKRFIFDQSSENGLFVFKNETPISIEQLSSGEKQIIILLTEALLQKSQDSIYIADEPELSLHIKWQKIALSSVLELNPNAQLIVATHSPEIAGKFRDNIIQMEDVVSE